MEPVVKRKVLIVDDEKGIAVFIKKLLEKLSLRYDVAIANCGIDAIRISNEMLPDIVILDIRIPDIDGFEICKSIRKNEKLKHTKVLVVSGSITPETESQILSCGADDFLSKPFDIKTFLAKFENLNEK